MENTTSKFLRAWPDQNRHNMLLERRWIYKSGKRLTIDMKHRTPKVRSVVFSNLMSPGRFSNINKQMDTHSVSPFKHLAVVMMSYSPLQKTHVPFMCFVHFRLISEVSQRAAVHQWCISKLYIPLLTQSRYDILHQWFTHLYNTKFTRRN